MLLARALVSAVLLTGGATSAGTAATGTAATGAEGSGTTTGDPSSATIGFYSQLTSRQEVVPGFVFVPRAHHLRHKGKASHSDQEFFAISSTGSNDVPTAALRAYKHAAALLATSEPGCHVGWSFLAAIGRVESNHGRFGGAQLGNDGISRPEIRGPELNGAGAFAAIHDSDGGRLDHDKVWDRAVGPMQFLPSTWHSVGRDGDGDGVADPDDLDDAALSAGVYLCGAGDLSGPAGMARAAFRYNQSDYYVRLVLSFAAGYQTGVFATPTPPPPPTKAARPQHHTKRHVKQHHVRHHSHHTVSTHVQHPSAPKPSSGPKPTAPKPPATPTPTPTPPAKVQLGGTWTSCGGGYCVDGVSLDLGPSSRAGLQAAADFDGDGTVETNALEGQGLVGQSVTMLVTRSGGSAVVYVIGNHDFRHADGSFA